jgi:uncharacterized membrane protein YdjX (TVP38/TMEM64 family)
MHEPRTDGGRNRALGRAGPVAVFAMVVPITGSVTVLIAGPLMAPWLRDQGTAGVLYFIATFALLGAVAFAPTYTTSVIAGWTFGFRVGYPAVVVGTVGGAALCYLGARWCASERVHSAFSAHPKWEVVRRALFEASAWKALWLVFLLRLSPVLPFGTTNVLLATTGVRPGVYLAGTLLGLLPRTGLVALAAASAERLDFDAAESWWLLVVGIVASGACIAAFGIIGKRALDRATRLSAQGCDLTPSPGTPGEGRGGGLEE